ncbi:lysophospholipid acyltransferase family protein [Chelatococcus composti]|jgi:1-acyl-sn-glycerol-3-phosphate acyltransferase|uniref:1-acyl-sn-glycerol-3-phosphate acyltransferase n=1 Tax=Chelatococcus composti TaxID=1743235 RepID=A0A841KDH6_9HYPH|nr:lysophospholipid acyltransferase family protein [Chelatococcus composti]MBB6167503.1 1-acyl-sn-glycerol-3-phosphate acyltransferase [Chelatococcus composti]MBS7735707.1 1-acyl-sn-glycerol-3-phosphate acyltransferase [Chelatococcus composti]PZN42063.1 MAG: 1-acyl-sn-glycerol-3-phosphate acyltransferase [Pseudomonadota bacterium]GGG32385.1 1-acyl-sn-glycerol-3-phosphate acyltransferase [Chelatococcus composti]
MLSLRGILRLSLIVPATLIGIPLQALAVRLDSRAARIIPLLYHRFVCRVLGIRIKVEGTPPNGREATLILANHVSWLDIPVISTLTPLSFIAKAEVNSWPIVGLLARLQRTVFIDRTRRKATATTNVEVARRLRRGDVMVLFAEGTTGDGLRILPFRSALVGAAREAVADADAPSEIVLRPLAITYVGRQGLPLSRSDRPGIAWHGDMELAPHLAAVLSGAPLDVRITWGEPIPFNGESDRKQATRWAEEVVRAATRAARAAGP